MRAVVLRLLSMLTVAVLMAAAGLHAQTAPSSKAPSSPAQTTGPQPTPAAAAAAPSDAPRPGAGGLTKANDDPFPSTYKAPAAKPFAITNATILTAAGPAIPNGTILLPRRQDRRGRRDGRPCPPTPR